MNMVLIVETSSKGTPDTLDFAEVQRCLQSPLAEFVKPSHSQTVCLLGEESVYGVGMRSDSRQEETHPSSVSFSVRMGSDWGVVFIEERRVWSQMSLVNTSYRDMDNGVVRVLGKSSITAIRPHQVSDTSYLQFRAGY